MASNVLTKDEQLAKLAGQIEQLIYTTVRQNNGIEPADARKMLAKLALKATTQRLQRKITEPIAIATV